MSSANYQIMRNAAASGSGWGLSTNYASSGTVNELPLSIVTGSTSSSSNYALGPGLMNIAFFPGKIVTFPAPNIFVTSGTLQWNTTGYDGSLGALQSGTTYFIRLATYTVPDTFSFAYANISISTNNTSNGMNPGSVASLGQVSLFPNTTYYAAIWTDDSRGDISFASNRSTFTTLTFPPGIAAPTFANVSVSSMSATWADPGNNQINLTTYTVVLTSDTNNDCTHPTFTADSWPNNIVSSPTAAALLAASVSTNIPVGYLDNNTTYFVWAEAMNPLGTPSAWVCLGATSTLSLPVTSLSPGTQPYDYQYVFFSSATAQWAALPAHPPVKGSSEGYLLMASTTNFGALTPGGVVLTSATIDVRVSSLTIDFTNGGTTGLDNSTTWYFKVGSLNHNSAWNPVDLTRLNMQISLSTYNFTLGTINPGVFQSTVSMSSMVVTNVGNIAATYNVWANTVAPCLYSLGTSRGVEQAVLQGQWYTGGPPAPSSASFGAIGTNDITASTATSSGSLYLGNQSGAAVSPGASRTMWFQFWLPGSTADSNKEHIIVGAAPTYP